MNKTVIENTIGFIGILLIIGVMAFSSGCSIGHSSTTMERRVSELEEQVQHLEAIINRQNEYVSDVYEVVKDHDQQIKISGRMQKQDSEDIVLILKIIKSMRDKK